MRILKWKLLALWIALFFLYAFIPISNLAAPSSIRTTVKSIVNGLPTRSPLAVGDINGNGHIKLITAASDQSDGLSIRNATGHIIKTYPELTNITSIALSDLDGDGAKEILLGVWDLQKFPDEQRTLAVYKWNGKDYYPILRSNQIGTVCRIFSLGSPGQERAVILSKDIRGYWLSLITYHNKPVILWKKKIPGPAIYVGELYGKQTVICMREKPFSQSPLPGAILGYTFGGFYQYAQNPRSFIINDDGLSETRDLQIPYRGAVWGLEIGELRQKGRQELILGVETGGKPLLKIYEMGDKRLKEITTLDPDCGNQPVLGFLKMPSVYRSSLHQIVTTSGSCLYFDGKDFQIGVLEHVSKNLILNMAAAPERTLYVLTRTVQQSTDGEDELITAGLNAVTIHPISRSGQ